MFVVSLSFCLIFLSMSHKYMFLFRARNIIGIYISLDTHQSLVITSLGEWKFLISHCILIICLLLKLYFFLSLFFYLCLTRNWYYDITLKRICPLHSHLARSLYFMYVIQSEFKFNLTLQNREFVIHYRKINMTCINYHWPINRKLMCQSFSSNQINAWIIFIQSKDCINHYFVQSN